MQIISWLLVILLMLEGSVLGGGDLYAEEAEAVVLAESSAGLSEEETSRVSQSVDKALDWLAKQQRKDGSYAGPRTGQPGITSLAVLAYLSAGHLPGEGEYGRQLEQAIDYTLSCEISEGYFTANKPGSVWQFDEASHTATYNQAIAALMLAEVSGELKGELGKRVTAGVERALAFTKRSQFVKVPGRPQDEGGWRYPEPCPQDNYFTDLSVTAWQVTFLRSAKNAGFDVDKKMIDLARKYVKGLYKSKKRNFTYDHRRVTRGVTGAGIMAMAMLGEHNTVEVKAATEWLHKHPFVHYGQRVGFLDRFQYSVYYCTQAMYQVGGEDWRRFYPTIAKLLMQHQLKEGHWPAVSYERPFGEVYTTSMSVLSLTAPYSMLPIHQR